MTLSDSDVAELKSLSGKYPSCAKMLEMLDNNMLSRYLTIKTQLDAWENEITESPVRLSAADKSFERVSTYLSKIGEWNANMQSIYKSLTTDEKEEAIDKTKKPKKQSSQIPATLKRN